MKELLSFEFRKLWRSKSFWICSIVMVVLKIAGIVITAASQNMLKSLYGDQANMISDADLALFNSSGIKELVSASSGSNMTILFAIFVTLFICTDFTEGTIKNILSRGFSRQQVYAAKSITIIAGGLLFSLLSMLIGFTGGSIAFGVGNGFNGTLIVTLLIQLLALIAYIMMNVLLAVLFTKAGGAMTLGIIIPMVVPLLGQLGDLAIASIVEGASLNDKFISKFLIGTNLSSISNLGVPGGDLALAAAVFAAYAILFTFLGFLSIRKKEV